MTAVGNGGFSSVSTGGVSRSWLSWARMPAKFASGPVRLICLVILATLAIWFLLISLVLRDVQKGGY